MNAISTISTINTMNAISTINTIPICLFDYATVSRLATVSKAFHRRATIEQERRNRFTELLAYIKTVPTTREQIIYNTLSLHDVWSIFEVIIKNKYQESRVSHASHNSRYIYFATPLTDTCVVSACYTAGTEPMMIHAHVTFNLSIVSIFTHAILNRQKDVTLQQLYICTDYVVTEYEHSYINDNQFSSWILSNVSLAKIDLITRSIYYSDTFIMSSDNHTIANDIFPYIAHDNLIRCVLEAIIL